MSDTFRSFENNASKPNLGTAININREVQKTPEASKRIWNILILENGDSGKTT
jgi:hypothetical protein